MSSCLTLITILVYAFLLVDAIPVPSLCPTAIFGFADSLSDTGNRNWEAENTTISGSFPYGVTLGEPTGRYSDGYVLIDYLVQDLHLEADSIPSNAYNGSYFRSLNFAYAGATVVTVPDNPMFSAHNFSMQVQDFLKHKSRMQRRYPRQNQEWFEQALYYIEIGGDDINANIFNGSDAVLNTSIPKAVAGLRTSIMDLHKAGAKNFLLFNMPAAGCSPTYLNLTRQFPDELKLDNLGCISFINRYAQAFDARLNAMAEELRNDYPHMNIYYFDWYSASIEVLKNMNKYNFTNSRQACCGVGGGDFNCDGVLCGCASDPNYTVCKHPERYITFDGIHYSQHFSRVMADFIMNHKYLTPHVKFVRGCQVPVPYAPDDGWNTPI